MKIVLIILGVLAALIAGFGMLVALFLFTAEDLPVSESEKAMFVSAADLVPYFDDYAPSVEHETFSKVEYFDKSVEITYDYESTVDEDPYISSGIHYEPTKEDADTSFTVLWKTYTITMKAFGIETKENNSFYSAGDRSRFGDFVNEYGTVGHVLMVQKGSSLYSFLISGFTLDDATIWHELFDRKIEALSATPVNK